ncbi:hypothetical protein DF185_02195 [Marinifilum breve]|uniref:Uncharacterized protein n=2 Tax=Marinifilum breve TaxID=2184082 RepID=A0A2V4A2H9_9BACT|nr:hypothetical protein DF185_02195 [Marinifilum breve]
MGENHLNYHIMNFKSIQLRQLRHNEFIQYNKNFLEILTGYDLETLKVKVQSDSFASLLSAMTALYMPDRGSEITKLLEVDDARRDKAINGIQAVVEGFCNHFDAEYVMAATVLLNSLNKYGSRIAKQNYQGETATIDSILQEWKSENVLINALSKLSLTAWANELEVANAKFNSDYLDRVKEDAEQTDVKIIDIRNQMIESYRVLTTRIEAFATISDDQTYSTIINQVNSVIPKYNAVVDARKPKKEEKETNEEEAVSEASTSES